MYPSYSFTDGKTGSLYFSNCGEDGSLYSEQFSRIVEFAESYSKEVNFELIARDDVHDLAAKTVKSTVIYRMTFRDPITYAHARHAFAGSKYLLNRA